ncbi:MAG TPA: AEC family transporter [Anaerolineae bacterium]
MTDLFGTLLDVTLPVALVTLLGYLAGRLGWISDSRTLARLTLNILLPALAFSSLYQAHLTGDELLNLSIFTVVNMGLVLALSYLIVRALALDAVAASAFMLSTMMINAGNYGMPINQSAYGEEGLARATVFFVSSLVVNQTVGLYIASSGHADPLAAIRDILVSPLVYSAILGLLLNRLHLMLPTFLAHTLELAGSAAIPMMLIILGAQLANAEWDTNWWHASIAGALRLIGAPLLAFAVLLFFPLQGLSRNVGILQASMPTAVLASVFATEYQAKPRFVTSVVLITTLGSLVTIPVLITLLR